MADKTMLSPGPWHVNKPKGRPHRDVLTQTQQCVARVKPARADGKHHAKANAALIAAAGTAAHECAQMGYDPIACMKRHAQLLRLMNGYVYGALLLSDLTEGLEQIHEEINAAGKKGDGDGR
jgi:hypothetical protein